jgi:hypothetical protein
MLSGRIIRFVFLAAIMAAAWGYLDHVQNDLSQARSDLLTRTRFLVRQAQTADAETRERLYARYRLPDGDATQQKEQFEQLWSVLRACEPGTVAYADGTPAQDEASHPRRQVILQGKDEQGRPARVRLDWVRVNDMWYIEDGGTGPARRGRTIVR